MLDNCIVTLPTIKLRRALCAELLPFVTSFSQGAEGFFNSVFFTAIAGSLAGAFGGAYAAQRIAEKSRDKNEVLKEIRNTNAAIIVAFSICNTLISAKKQHVRALKAGFDNLKTELSNRQPLGGVFSFQADFRTLNNRSATINSADAGF
jgi:hypothetical protein